MGKKGCGGFTLIELALSMVFIAILSVTVVLLIQNVSASYRRGMILNQLNTVGMDLIDDFRISVQNATSDTVDKICDNFYRKYENYNEAYKNCLDDAAASFTLVGPGTAKVTVKDMHDNGEYEITDSPVYGAFCTGTYTYIWNSGYFEFNEEEDYRKVTINPRKEAILAVAKGGEKLAENFRLIKVYDAGRSVCVNEMLRQQDATVGEKPTSYKKFGEYKKKFEGDFKVNSEGELVDLLAKGDLVIYDLYIGKPVLSTTRNNLFYAASFVLGTKRGGANMQIAGNACKPPSDDYSELEYCAINKFNFAVMAGGYGG